MPLRRRDGRQRQTGSSPPPASAKSSPVAPGGEELRQINLELQRLSDVMRPLEDILENHPSPDTSELVDIYMSEAQKKVEELQLHADFCVEQGHFDVFQQIADSQSNLDELRVRAESWKAAAEATPAASRQAREEVAAPSPPVGPLGSQASDLPQLEPLEATADPTLGASGGAQHSPSSLPQSIRSQGSADPTPAAFSAQPTPAAFSAQASPGMQSTRSQGFASDPTPGAFGGAQPSPGAFSAAQPSPAAFSAQPSPATFSAQHSPGSLPQSIRSQGSADPTPAAFSAQPTPAAFSAKASPGMQQSTPGGLGGAPSQSPSAQAALQSLGAEQTPLGLQTMGSQVPASQTVTGTSTWPSPTWGEWLWGSPPTPQDAPVTLPMEKPKSKKSLSRKKQMDQEAAKWKLQDAVRMSASDPHVLSAALHEAKENDVNDVAPELMKQAEDTLKQAHESGRRLEVEQELERAMTAVSTELKDAGQSARLRDAIQDATTEGVDVAKAEELLRQAGAASLQAAPAEPPRPVEPAEPWPQPEVTTPVPVQPVQPVQDVQHQSLAHEAWGVAEPAPSTPSSISIPQAPPPTTSSQMKEKVGKLLQTLLTGGSTGEQLDKAAEVAAAAGLSRESCDRARHVAEQRRRAHEEALAAMASGDVEALRSALSAVERAGGPAADRRQLTATVPSRRSPGGWETFRKREEHLVQSMKQAREKQLEEFRTAAQAAAEAARKSEAAARYLDEREPKEEPPKERWTNPFGQDPDREVFSPIEPNYDYRTLLSNAENRTKMHSMHSRPFEHPEFWHLRNSREPQPVLPF